ncbi:MAG: adenylate/guanylate cyclase domain-containing protein [Rhodospirillaceae bacterium]|nr:adenylate/guanylate cyclase domain-containing protein [Rhodospirillaceae bacterium]
MFADLAGFTRLTRTLDAEEVHRLLNLFFEVSDAAVRRHGGHIDKHIGDNVMALFGAPVAHTDDPARAVRTALEIHEAVTGVATGTGESLAAHIGIATGEVVASTTGSAAHQE